MSRGHRNRTCAEAIRASVGPTETISAYSLFERAKKLGMWRDSTIWAHLMSLVVNLPPARHYWPHTDPFLFLRADGQYELYSEGKHPPLVP